MIPGVQKPHWLPPLDASASANGSTTEEGNPSTVTTDLPATLRTAVTQATRG